MSGDVGSEEATDVEPCPPAQRSSGQGERHPGVEPPPSSPETVGGHGELEAGHRAAGAHHPGQLGDRWRRVGDVTEQVGEGEGVEGGVGEGQAFALAKDEGDAVVPAGGGHVASAPAEHVLAQVDADDPCFAALGQFEGDASRAGGHVEHGGRVGDGDVIDHLAPPPPVLAE